jgi:glycolate oxidase iron-sulfur subunit
MATVRNAYDFKELMRFADQIDLCAKCGLCTFFCPVYQEERDEATVARGKNRLLKELIDGETDFTEFFIEYFDKCLTCRRCVMYCPRGIETDKLITAVRADIVKVKGLPKTKRAVFRYLMSDRIRFAKTVKALSKVQWIIPKRMGKMRHIPEFVFALGKGREIPHIANRFLREEVPEIVSPPKGVETKLRVGLFIGCAIDFIYPQVGKTMINFLTQNGVEIVIPKEQECCGIAVYASGDLETARNFARNTLKTFDGLDNLDAIVTGCATCATSLKQGYLDYLVETEADREKYEKLSQKVRDITEFIIDVLKPAPASYKRALPENTKVTYHDACHLSRHLKITKQPREFIKSIPDLEFVEMEGADDCCGMGGSFNVYYYDISKKIADHKMKNIEKTGADVITTDCPGCLIQLNDGVARNKMSQKVMHIMELVK